MLRISENVLQELEARYEVGISSQEMLDVLASLDVKFSEATLRKYVQIGLLPRSVRVGRKGKHKGSQGLYPATVLRQILRIKEMMAEDYTIEEIQKEFLFVRGEIEELERTLEKVFDALKNAVEPRRSEPLGRSIAGDVKSAETLARELVSRLVVIEQRLTAQSRVQKRPMADTG